MGRLTELQSLIKVSEQLEDKMLHDCLMGLFCLVTAEVLDEGMYDAIFEKIKERIARAQTAKKG